MDGDLSALKSRQDDHLKEIPCGIRAEQKPAIGVVAGIFDSKGVIDGVENVIIGDTVSPSGVVNLHNSQCNTKRRAPWRAA